MQGRGMLCTVPEWRNGRRYGLKNRWGQPRTGSSPVSGTIRKPRPVERSTGFDFTTAKFTAKLVILPLLGFRLAPSGTHQTPSPIKGVPIPLSTPRPLRASPGGCSRDAARRLTVGTSLMGASPCAENPSSCACGPPSTPSPTNQSAQYDGRRGGDCGGWLGPRCAPRHG